MAYRRRESLDDAGAFDSHRVRILSTGVIRLWNQGI